MYDSHGSHEYTWVRSVATADAVLRKTVTDRTNNTAHWPDIVPL
jgi:hypothetical protein